MNQRHKGQVENMIGKKVTINFGGRKTITRVLHSDKDGLFIKYQGERVPCRPDTNTLNVLFFIALEPKYRKFIKSQN